MSFYKLFLLFSLMSDLSVPIILLGWIWHLFPK